MNLGPLSRLSDEWCEEADLLRRRGAPRQADALESAADDLEERLSEWRLERLTLEEAAEETGVSYRTAQRKVSEGEWENVGRKGAPRVLRAEVLPGLDPPGPEETDPVEDLARETLASRSG